MWSSVGSTDVPVADQRSLGECALPLDYLACVSPLAHNAQTATQNAAAGVCTLAGPGAP